MYRVLLEPDDNGTLLVIVAVGMLAAVRFHNEFRLDAGKIHNVGGIGCCRRKRYPS